MTRLTPSPSLRASKAYRNRPLAERLWEQVDKSGDCWVWMGNRGRWGYGRLCSEPGKRVLAHRVSWELLHGPIPEGMYVCHTCDNTPCVRPSHLFLGTQHDNMRDAARKGRIRNQNIGKTQCLRGHELAGANLRLYGGKRFCVACGEIRTRRRTQRKQAVAA